ncbi:MAG: PilZ domain-containing protein [Myxococcaceae bacterium]
MRASHSLAGSERRGPSERRATSLIDPSIEGRRDRRTDERRDSPRAHSRFWVKDPVHGGVSEVFDGDVSFGGASFLAMHPPHGEVLEFGMWLPGSNKELRTCARVIHRSRLAGATAVHLRFDAPKKGFGDALALYLLERTL